VELHILKDLALLTGAVDIENKGLIGRLPQRHWELRILKDLSGFDSKHKKIKGIGSQRCPAERKEVWRIGPRRIPACGSLARAQFEAKWGMKITTDVNTGVNAVSRVYCFAIRIACGKLWKKQEARIPPRGHAKQAKTGAPPAVPKAS
jgi:hypothetical protein